MKTLNELRKEAQNRRDWQSNPRRFIAVFPSGPRNGQFLDPFLGALQVQGMEGVIHMCDLELFNIPAAWLD